MTEAITVCPACGAAWRASKICQDDFYQMLFREAEDPANSVVHHLMVLSYHLQHPHLYSPEGLQHAMGLLVDFVEKGKTPVEVREQQRDRVNSTNRRWKITTRPGAAGSYRHLVTWTMTAGDVVAAGIDNYCASVRAWARSIYEGLKTSGNLPE